MKVIIPGRGFITKIWYTKNSDYEYYRPLKYLVEELTDDGLLLYNTVSGEMVLLNDEEKKAFDKLPGSFDSILEELITHRFVVPESYQEEKTLKQLRTILSMTDKGNGFISAYNILPTTNCNARCFYCYQSGYQHCNMSEETANELIDFIEKNHKGKNVHLSWFGGEPLVGLKRITQISNQLSDKRISFSSSMTSNGFLFDQNLVKIAKEEWNLQDIQITLDGTEDVYNSTKAYVNVTESPYKRVLNNISLLLDYEIAVQIRLNLDSYNADNLKTLITELGNLFGNKKDIIVYIHTLFEGEGFDPVNHSESEQRELFEKKVELSKLIRSNNLSGKSHGTLPFLRYRYCMADNPHSIQCSPDGKLGKCEHYIFEHTVGSLEEGISNRDELNRWTITDNWKICENCVFEPWCIHLLHCPTNDHICYEEEKNTRIRNLKSKMKVLYTEFLNNSATEPIELEDEDAIHTSDNC